MKEVNAEALDDVRSGDPQKVKVFNIHSSECSQNSVCVGGCCEGRGDGPICPRGRAAADPKLDPHLEFQALSQWGAVACEVSALGLAVCRGGGTWTRGCRLGNLPLHNDRPQGGLATGRFQGHSGTDEGTAGDLAKVRSPAWCSQPSLRLGQVTASLPGQLVVAGVQGLRG